jgi:DNA invertase Pin-like site-specific DNA recombinase
MLPKQNNYNVGIYLRLSKDDERVGESLSIENQRRILVKYVEEQGWKIYNTYIDDGISGTTFDRPGVQRMLDDAKNGRINLILCKDLSRFGRNYIQVGQYTDYIFPMYNIRFIALTDNIDTANSDSASMDMMPIMNVFNEWHAANTSKKLKAVFDTNAKAGKYKCTYCSYGYFKGDDENRTPVIDPYAATVVRRIFEMRAKGYNPKKIADILNAEKIAIPSDYQYQQLGRPNPHNTSHLWGNINVKRILNNPIYIGTLAQLRTTSVSYKNHKIIQKNEEDWAVIKNNHEPIVSQDLWDKCREVDKSVSHGKRDSKGITAPLSGFLYCDSCGNKMRAHGSAKKCKACLFMRSAQPLRRKYLLNALHQAVSD